MRNSAIFLLTLLAATCCTFDACAADPGAKVKFDVEAFRRLPVMFNGRVTDIDHYSRNLMRQISGAEGWWDEEQIRRTALDWLLDVMSGSESALEARIVLVEHPYPRKLLELPDGSDRHCSINDVLKKSESLEKLANEIRSSHRKRTDDERALIELMMRLVNLKWQMAMFRIADETDQDAMLAGGRLSQELDKEAIGFLVPPVKPGGDWQTLQYTQILNAVERDNPDKHRPAGDFLVKLIAARRKGKAAEFGQIVRDYSSYLNSNMLRACPFKFTAPPGWIESGVPKLGPLSHYGDTRAQGTTLAMLHRVHGLDELKITVNFFPSAATDKSRIVNSWRCDYRLAPQSLEQVATTPAPIAGHAGWRVDIESPAGLKRASRLLGAGVSIGSNTWIICFSGPKALMDGHVKDFDRFLKSLVLGAPAEVETWYALDKPEPVEFPPGTKSVVALVPDGQTLWVLSAVDLGEEKQEGDETRHQLVEKVRAVVKSIRFRPRGADDAHRLPFDWTLPEGWTLNDADGDELSVVAKDPFAVLTISPLSVTGGFSRPELINNCRAVFRLKELPSDQLKAATETLTVDERKVELIVTGP